MWVCIVWVNVLGEVGIVNLSGGGAEEELRGVGEVCLAWAAWCIAGRSGVVDRQPD